MQEIGLQHAQEDINNLYNSEAEDKVAAYLFDAILLLLGMLLAAAVLAIMGSGPFYRRTYTEFWSTYRYTLAITGICTVIVIILMGLGYIPRPSAEILQAL